MTTTTYQADTLTIELKEEYAIVQLNNGKVNAINTPLLKDLQATFTALDKDTTIRGAILAGRPHVFSAGLDVMSLASMNEAQMVDFWESYMGVMQTLVSFGRSCDLTPK